MGQKGFRKGSEKVQRRFKVQEVQGSKVRGSEGARFRRCRRFKVRRFKVEEVQDSQGAGGSP
jgi:hypothetical protein